MAPVVIFSILFLVSAATSEVPLRDHLQREDVATYKLNLTIFSASSPVITPSDHQRRVLRKSRAVPAQRADGKYVLYVHIHKAGGGYLCGLAKQNVQMDITSGMKHGDGWGVPNKRHGGGTNCNMPGDGPKRWVRYSSVRSPRTPKTCENTVEKFSRYRFAALERYLIPESEVCPTTTWQSKGPLIYVTCLREPLARISSAMRMHKITGATVAAWATKDSPCPEDPITQGTSTVDNFAVRTFAGENTFLKPLGRVTKEDLALAKKSLGAFTVVMILERFDRDIVQLTHLLGWSLPRPHNVSSSQGGEGARETAAAVTMENMTLSSKQRGILERLNMLDSSFYQYADEVAARVSAECRLAIKRAERTSATA